VMPEELAVKLRHLRACTPNVASPYVFQDANGGPIAPEEVRAARHAAQDAAGVKHFTPHGLRRL